MVEEYHKLFTGGKGKGLIGDAALESVQKNWSKSNIARLTYKSNRMAINQATEIYLGVEPLSKAQPRKKKAAGGVSVPVSTPTAVAAGEGSQACQRPWNGKEGEEGEGEAVR